MSALLIGYGNPGRGDDGLGPLFAGRIGEAKLPGLDVDIDYQLTVEHAYSVAFADMVIFADAAMGQEQAFRLSEIKPDEAREIGSHALSPETVLSLARTLFGKSPLSYVLAISGQDFGEVKEGLSAFALANLGQAEAHFLDWYRCRQLIPQDRPPGNLIGNSPAEA